MSKVIALKLWLLFQVIAFGAYADHEDVVHTAAHVGTAYTLTTTCYGVSKKTLGINTKAVTLPLCGGLVVLAGVLYDSTEPSKSSSAWKNSLGVVLSVGSVLAFDF